MTDPTHWRRFPTEDVSLVLLEAACNINPDTGHHTVIISLIEEIRRLRAALAAAGVAADTEETAE